MKEIYFFIAEHDIEGYAELSGDHNPIHLDGEYARKHGFSGKIAHGMLTMAKVWSVLSNELLTSKHFPRTYEFAFLSPVYPGDVVILQIEEGTKGLNIVGACNGKMVVKGHMAVY